MNTIIKDANSPKKGMVFRILKGFALLTGLGLLEGESVSLLKLSSPLYPEIQLLD